MKRIKFFVLAAILLVSPLTVSAAGLVPCGGAGEPDCQMCHLVNLTNNVVEWLVIILAVVVAIIITVAGFKLVTSAGNVSEKESAKSLITNAIIGFIIVLAGWLFIDLVMKSLVYTDGQIDGGPWNVVECVEQAKSRAGSEFGGDPNIAPELSMKADCTPQSLESYGMTEEQAKVFSCIAGPESACNLNAQNGWTSARGVFQIVRGLNDKCHNLNLPACTAAAEAKGYVVDGDLDCSTAFTGGTTPSNPSRAKEGMEELFEACNDAASNMACNTAAALCLYNDGGGYNHWLGRQGFDEHEQQRACVAKYAN